MNSSLLEKELELIFENIQMLHTAYYELKDKVAELEYDMAKIKKEIDKFPEVKDALKKANCCGYHD